jgi:hypothetical protein
VSFDNSRFTFNPWNDYCGVVMEQGRVQLDSDWNEWLAELSRRSRAETLDILGCAVYPATTPYAFYITASNSGGKNTISIGPGRMYVDGLLAENHGVQTSAQWDPALAEMSGSPQPPPATETDTVDYTGQRYFPNPPAISGNGPFLAYLDVWMQPITYLEDPDLVDKAVGVDTTGRLQTVWQVKLMSVPSGTTCASAIAGWPPAPSAGQLTNGTVSTGPSGPCCLTTNTGYTGMENQFYRVEIHQPGTPDTVPATLPFTYPLPAGTATFKWSRDNASVATLVTAVNAVTNSVGNPASQLTVQSMGRDQVLGFAPGNWIEIIDDNLELNGLPGELHQIDSIDFSGKTITLDHPVSTTSFPVDSNNQTNPSRNTRIQRWDQSGKVYESDNQTVWVDLGAAGSTGDIPVPPAGTSLILENGVTVTFGVSSASGAFAIGDFWTFAARTADGSVEQLTKAPPRGIHHHYAALSIVDFSVPIATDCRIKWRPPTSSAGGGCDCASCVTAQSHNSGSWTIQSAINAVQAQGGGKVCLGPGLYNIAAVINIVGAQNLAICGHGLPLLQPSTPFTGDAIMLINACVDIDVEGIAFTGAGPVVGATATAGTAPALAGLMVQNSSVVRVEDCLFGLITEVASNAAPLSPAITFLDTTVVDCTICDNLFNNVGIGIGFSDTDDFLLKQLKIEDNWMVCQDGAVFMSSRHLFVSEIRFAGNSVQSTSGFVLSGQGIDVSIEDNTFSIAPATSGQNVPSGAAVACNVSQTRVINNQIAIRTSTLTASSSGTQGLPAGSYIWVVTAVNGSGRESLITGLASLTLAGPANVMLQWTAVTGAASYNIYRSVVNSSALLRDGTVLPGSSTTVSYTDTVSDSSLSTPLPAMQNDGIVLGPAPGSIMYGTQIIGNRISGLIGLGIWAAPEVSLLESILAENQLLNLGGNGIVVDGLAADIDVARNSLAFVAQLPVSLVSTGAAGIQLRAAINANLSENRIENVGSLLPGTHARGAIYILVASGARITGNRIADIAPAVLRGIYAGVLNGLDVADNVVRRASTVPPQPDQSTWLAMQVFGDTLNVRGNLLESFGGIVGSQPPQPSTATIAALQSCIFSNNQCFLDDPSGKTSPTLVVEVAGHSIIAMGNRVQGPSGEGASSMALVVPVATNIPSVTVVGNITTAGILVNSGPVPAAMAPLNIIA